MKKFFAILLPCLVVLLSGFKPFEESYQFNINTNCTQLEVGATKLTGTFNGSMFRYQIDYCSKRPQLLERYVKFKVELFDEGGNLIAKSSTGPTVKTEVSGEHSAGVPVNQKPYKLTLTWSYRDGNGVWNDVSSVELILQK